MGPKTGKHFGHLESKAPPVGLLKLTEALFLEWRFYFYASTTAKRNAGNRDKQSSTVDEHIGRH